MNLEALWKSRSNLEDMKIRDADYQRYENAYHKRDKSGAPSYIESFKPLLLDMVNQDKVQKLLNPSAQVVKHFAAMFSRLPRISNTPFDGSPSSITLSSRMTALIYSIANNSGMKALQPLQAHRFSLRGDSVYGVEWDKKKQQIYWRGFDPSWCYPALSTLDFGGVDDILIHYMVDRKWAAKVYGVDIDTKLKSKAKVFVYWDAQHKETQVENLERVGEGSHTFDHALGFTPFRWGFSQPTGYYAQSDIQDVVELSDVMNEAMVLALDALRMNIYPAYWGKAIKEGLRPRPGEVIALNSPEAEINVFPTSPPPDMVMGLLSDMQQQVRSAGGMSPVSAEGMVGGSIVTGAAVRHQVEAIEARAETKRVILEALFGKLGEYTLKVLEREFPDSPFIYRKDRDNFDTVTGDEVRGWTTCEADYGIVGMDFASRQRLALEGLGRVHDGYEAIRITHPEANPAEMYERVITYQIQQSEMTARAQMAAQKIASADEGAAPTMEGGQPVPGSAPPSSPQPPQPSQFMQKIGQIQDALKLVATTLKGKVWAIGEMAITGMATQPMVMVESEKDVPAVQSALQAYHALVTPGEPKDMPHIKIA